MAGFIKVLTMAGFFESLGILISAFGSVLWGLLLVISIGVFLWRSGATDRHGPVVILAVASFLLLLIGLIMGLISGNWVLFKAPIVALIITSVTHTLIAVFNRANPKLCPELINNTQLDLVLFASGLSVYAILRSLDVGCVLIQDN